MKRIVTVKRRVPVLALSPALVYDSFHCDGYKYIELKVWFMHWSLGVSIALGKKKVKAYDNGTAKEG